MRILSRHVSTIHSSRESGRRDAVARVPRHCKRAVEDLRRHTAQSVTPEATKSHYVW
jgi:hypothetical protein